MTEDSVPLDALLQGGAPRRSSSDTIPGGLPPAYRPPPAPASKRGKRVLLAIGVGGLIALLVALVLPHLGQDGARTPVAALAPAPLAKAVTTPAATPSPSPTVQLKPSRAVLAISPKKTSAGPAPALPWPASGQAIVEVPGLGVLGHSGSSRAVPIASITKVMTAYTVLRDHPLGRGQSGPTITVSEAEAAAYAGQKAAGESVVQVAAGEKLTQREALKGLLIASGGNMAEILARWDASSVPAFVQRMNSNARRLGMSSTHYADTGGLSPSSVSTVRDLLRLAPAAMAQPTLAELVGTSASSIPLNEHIANPNSLLGLHGIVGIKTGTTTAAGGCLLFAAHREVDGRTMTIYGAVLGISGDRSAIHSNARDAADALVVGAGDALHPIALVRAGQTVATLTDRKGRPVQLTVAKDVTVRGWSGQKFRFALPSSLRKGVPPKQLTVHTPSRTFTVKLVAK